MTAQDRAACQVVVHGRVQGVFFRDTCRRHARENGVGGWVRNEYDGSVRALFEGAPHAVERMVTWAHEGPSRAVVDTVEVTDVEPSGLTDFEVR